MSRPIAHLASWILASMLALGANATLEPPSCSAQCVDAANHVCFFQGRWLQDKKLKIGYSS